MNKQANKLKSKIIPLKRKKLIKLTYDRLILNLFVFSVNMFLVRLVMILNTYFVNLYIKSTATNEIKTFN